MKIDDFTALIPKEIISSSSSDREHYGKDWCKDFKANASLILFPRSYEEVVQIVKAANTCEVPLVPSGGRTGLSGGATATNQEAVLSLEKLNKVLEVNQIDRTITCQAGVITQRVQEVAKEAGLYFPIDFSSKGSSQIGGNVATNAGGVRVLRYGNTRDWVLGLKVVTPKGELLELNGSLYKNQTGYDLRSLYIGSEGTLGVIVEVTLRLISPPGELIRALCGVSDRDTITSTYRDIRAKFPTLSMFEYFSESALAPVLAHHQIRKPLAEPHPHYLLIEVEETHTGFRDHFEEYLVSLIEGGCLADVVVSQSSAVADQLLSYREKIPETLSSAYFPHKNDISVPISSIPPFLNDLDTLIIEQYPDLHVAVFGHIGDGNLHVNILKPETMDRDEFLNRCHDSDRFMFELVKRYRGSVSAEHGVGLLKRDFLSYSRSASEIILMRSLKSIIDPNSIMNPGKIFEFKSA